MKIKITVLILFLFCLLFAPLHIVYGEPSIQSLPSDNLTVFQLLEKQTELDGKVITFQGELIGQAIYEKNGVFVNLMDTEFNALGVYMDKSMVQKLTHYGRHGTQGDLVKASGTFHKICAMHGGDTDLHADDIEILKKGEIIPEPKISLVKITLSLLLPLLVLFLFLTSREKKKQ